MPLGKVVVKTKSLAALKAQTKLQPVSDAGRLDAEWMLRGRGGCYGNDVAELLRAVRPTSRVT